jgi:glucans biosynthesis protein
LRRRAFLLAGLVLPAIAAPASLRHALIAGATADPSSDKPSDKAPFEAGRVRALARELAAAPYKAGDTKLPPELADMKYDGYRQIRFVPDRALWRSQKLPFETQFFHRGSLYKDRVEIFEVAGGTARPIPYSSDMFTQADAAMPNRGDLGFAGFRLHAPMNRPDYYDEVCAFLGASYFRAVAKNQVYGLSARGLALKTADRGGEEFPGFRAFWLERPDPRAASIVVHALLDSVSAAAAYRFTIRPGETTVFDVEMALYPRVDLEQPGIAPLTSMFYFAPHDRDGTDDFRPAVHDSDGLAIRTGSDERLWRPLSNPKNLQVSSFVDHNPRGFGLMQRERRFAGYQDLEARYEKRPGLWVEPIGDWGEGEIFLVEIPTQGEIHDNIVSFWRPRGTLRAKAEYLFNYRLHWCGTPPDRGQLATAEATRMGASWTKDHRLVVVDFVGENLKQVPPDAPPKPEVSAGNAKVVNVVAQPNPETGGWRLSFDMPIGREPIELRARLIDDKGPLTETWLYRWTP